MIDSLHAVNTEPGNLQVVSGMVKSADRTMKVLEALADGRSRTLAEFAIELQVPKSSLHSILRTMQARGWLQADASGSRFALGVRSLLPAPAYLKSDDIVSCAGPALDALAATLDETIHLGRLESSEVIYLAKRESTHALRLVSAIGVRLPAHATALGKSLLALRRPTELDDIASLSLPRLTERTITDVHMLRDDLVKTAKRGYAIDWGESTLGLCCTGVAIRDGDSPCYAISCSVPEVRIDSARIEQIVAALMDARDRIEAAYQQALPR